MTEAEQRRAMRRTQTVRLTLEEWAYVQGAMLFTIAHATAMREGMTVVSEDLREQLGVSPISSGEEPASPA